MPTDDLDRFCCQNPDCDTCGRRGDGTESPGQHGHEARAADTRRRVSHECSPIQPSEDGVSAFILWNAGCSVSPQIAHGLS